MKNNGPIGGTFYFFLLASLRLPRFAARRTATFTIGFIVYRRAGKPSVYFERDQQFI